MEVIDTEIGSAKLTEETKVYDWRHDPQAIMYFILWMILFVVVGLIWLFLDFLAHYDIIRYPTWYRWPFDSLLFLIYFFAWGTVGVLLAKRWDKKKELAS